MYHIYYRYYLHYKYYILYIYYTIYTTTTTATATLTTTTTIIATTSVSITLTLATTITTLLLQQHLMAYSAEPPFMLHILHGGCYIYIFSHKKCMGNHRANRQIRNFLRGGGSLGKS